MDLLPRRLIIFLLFFPLYIPSVAAQEESLDALFAALKESKNETTAREYEHQIWLHWFKSGDERINTLMLDAVSKRNQYDFNGALEILNKIIEMKPDYAEVWNQRATVYFHQREYEKSLWDVSKTLELEPRHFGAMAGRAVIRLFQGKPTLAYQNILQALEYHPYIKEREFFPNL